MMKLLKAIGLLITLFIAINLLAWGLVGRGTTLALAPRFFDHFGPYTEPDTLHVFDGYGAVWDDSLSTPGDFSRHRREAFLKRLREVSNAQVVSYHDTVGEPFAEETINFGVWVNRRYPLVAHVTSAVSTSGYAADYSQWYVWIFSWQPVGQPRIGES